MSITLHISRTIHQCKMIYLQWFFLIFQNFDFQGGQKGKREKNEPKWQSSVRCTLYYRNHTSYDLYFWHTHVRYFFYFFKILILGVFLTPHLRNFTSYDCDFRYTWVKWWYLQYFFSFFQNFDFWGFLGVKGQKMT